MNNLKKYIIGVTALLTTTGFAGFAQRDTVLQQEVEVVKAYRPSVADAFKINEMPKIEEQEHQKPSFNYNIFSQPVFSAFSVNTLQAATITGKPKEDFGYGLLKLGAGNYAKPYGEFFFNNNQSKNTQFGLHLKHLSSHGKVKLEGGDKVKSPFAENVAEIFAKRFYSNSTLSFNAAFNRDGFNYYGYPNDTVPALLKTEGQTINLFGTKQAFTKGGFNLSLENTSKAISSTKFGFDLNYHYFGTKTGQREHLGTLVAHVSKPINKMKVLADFGVTYYSADSIKKIETAPNDVLIFAPGRRQQLWVFANPAVYFGKENANFKAGAKLYVVDDKDAKLAVRVTPDVRLNITPVKGILDFFAGVGGEYVMNNYSKIAYENPFADPTHDVKNSLHQFRFFGGFNGKFSSKTNYSVSANHSIIKDQPFYYLQQLIVPTSEPLPSPVITANDFKILYDNLSLTNLSLEVYHTASEKLNLLFSGNYYLYSPENEKEAWNMPEFEAKLSASYKITPQLEVSTDIFAIGKRTALLVETGTIYNSGQPVDLENLTSATFKEKTLDTVFDLNFSATYLISGNFSVFGQLNNFGFQKYERWLGYPVQSFNFMGGISYSF